MLISLLLCSGRGGVNAPTHDRIKVPCERVKGAGLPWALSESSFFAVRQTYTTCTCCQPMAYGLKAMALGLK